jgi:hypothetical protein
MSWSDWQAARTYADWRLRIKSPDELSSEDFDG